MNENELAFKNAEKMPAKKKRGKGRPFEKGHKPLSKGRPKGKKKGSVMQQKCSDMMR